MARKPRDTFHPLVGCIDPLFTAWLAGFIDGEGCFNIEVVRRVRRATGEQMVNFLPGLIISNNAVSPLEEIQTTLQCGRVLRKRISLTDEARYRTPYQYWVDGKMAREVARLVLPYLRIKRAHAEIFVEFPEYERMPVYRWLTTIPDDVTRVVEARERLYHRLRELNTRGHDVYTPRPLITPAPAPPAPPG